MKCCHSGLVPTVLQLNLNFSMNRFTFLRSIVPCFWFFRSIAMVRDLERVLHEALDGASKSSSSIPSSSFQPLDQTFAAKMLSYWSGTRAWYQVKFFWPSSSGWRALSSIRHRAESLITLETVYRRVALAPILRFIDKLPRQQMSGSALAIFFFSYWLFISSHMKIISLIYQIPNELIHTSDEPWIKLAIEYHYYFSIRNILYSFSCSLLVKFALAWYQVKFWLS